MGHGSFSLKPVDPSTYVDVTHHTSRSQKKSKILARKNPKRHAHYKLQRHGHNKFIQLVLLALIPLLPNMMKSFASTCTCLILLCTPPFVHADNIQKSKPNVKLCSTIRGGTDALTDADALPRIDGSATTMNSPVVASSNLAGKLNRPVKGMPSVFDSEELVYDRYAACLAATESLRQTRDTAIIRASKAAKRQQNEGMGLLHRLRSALDRNDQQLNKNIPENRQANAQYLINASRVIKALGLTVPQFNSLSREINADDAMRDRVMEQAYLYRIAATLNMKRVPLLEDSDSQDLLKAHRRKRVQMFARSISEIEELRNEQMAALINSLRIDRIPDGLNICDPQVLPILSPKVRAVCEAFPMQAEQIVKKYGLNSDEFNAMLEETQTNPVFRWRVNQYMEKASAEE